MFIPVDYKGLSKDYPCRYAALTLYYDFHFIEDFGESPFKPFLKEVYPLEERECPECGKMSPIWPSLLEKGVLELECDECGTFEMSRRDLTMVVMDVEALIRAIADLHGFDCEKRGKIWFFGKVPIGGKSRNVLFACGPSPEEVDELLEGTNSILIALKVFDESKIKYPHQLYTVDELQIDSKRLELNLALIGNTVVDKPKTKPKIKRYQEDNAIRTKMLKKILEQEIYFLKQALLPSNKRMLEAYTTPGYRILAEKITLEGIKTSHTTVAKLINQKENWELKYLYETLHNPERVKNYINVIHAKTVEKVNR